jgi:transposase
VKQLADPHLHVTLYQLWLEYKTEHPNGYELTHFRDHYRQNTIATKKISTILADLHVHGEKIYLDFSGDTMSYVDVPTSEIIKVQIFVACLPATDYAFSIAAPSLREEDFVYAFIQCLRQLEGVSKNIVPDNLDAVYASQ